MGRRLILSFTKAQTGRHLIDYRGHSHYDQQRRAGKAHHAVLRALAFKWIRILWRCWHDQKPYDEQHYLAALRRQGSPLAAALQKT